MQPIKIAPEVRRGDWAAGFGMEIFYPGRALGALDSGVGAIGRVDRARISPGHVIGMHPHKDDEILTYIRAGRMHHLDTVGNDEEVGESRFMMMNAGRSFQHEEHMLPGDHIEALQIFLRPRAPDLEPGVQFHDFAQARSEGAWRLLGGPMDAPLEIRAQAWVRDAYLAARTALPLPPPDAPASVHLLFVLSGVVRVGDLTAEAGQSVYIPEGGLLVEALADADLVLLSTDPAAPAFDRGMFSGNVLRQ
jgi:redox-sensitive bicupin YhaK (pirin superfamily)